MRINKDKNKGEHYLNEDNVVVKQGWHEGLIAEGSNHYGVGDSLGRNAYAALIYDYSRNDILKGLGSFFTYERTSPETGYHWYVKRYPKGERYAVKGNSRDHVLTALGALKLLGASFPKEYITNRAKRPCIDHPFTIDQKLLMKSFYSNRYSYLYAGVYTIKALFRRLSMTLLRLSTLRHLRHAKDIEDFTNNRPVAKNKWAKFVAKKQLIHPTYALLYEAFSRHAMASNKAKRWTFILDRILRFADKGNLVLKALYGRRIRYEELLEYKYTNSNRWSCRLDFTNDRDMCEVDYVEGCNVYNDLLNFLFIKQEMNGRKNPFQRFGFSKVTNINKTLK